jgi:hypothetical protein
MNGASLNEKIASPEGRLAKWLKDSGMSDTAIADQIFLTALSRHATQKEKSAVLAQIAASPPPNRAQVLQDTLWALINSREFIYNH